MPKANQKNNNTDDRSRQRPALVLLLVVLIAAAFFIMSDISFVKSARDALMQKLGYEAIDQESSSENSGDNGGSENSGGKTAEWDVNADLDPSSLPEFNGQNYVKVSGGVPVFPDDVCERAGLIKDGDGWKTKGNLLGTVDSNKLTPYEYYGSLDELGRCTYAYGLLGEETMPQEGQERGDISFHLKH